GVGVGLAGGGGGFGGVVEGGVVVVGAAGDGARGPAAGVVDCAAEATERRVAVDGGVGPCQLGPRVVDDGTAVVGLVGHQPHARERHGALVVEAAAGVVEAAVAVGGGEIGETRRDAGVDEEDVAVQRGVDGQRRRSRSGGGQVVGRRRQH